MSRTIQLEHEGASYDAQIVTIDKTTLGGMEHCNFTFALRVKDADSTFEIGHYPLMGPHGAALLKRIIDTVGIESWEELQGATMLALFGNDDQRAVGIAHLIEDRVLIFKSTIDTLVAANQK